MIKSFFFYFLSYIFKAKTRQTLLFLAIFGLFVSSFSLIVLQSTMGGLQHKLKGRSKSVEGVATLIIRSEAREKLGNKELMARIEKLPGQWVKEYRVELLARNGKYMAPIVLHGVPKQTTALKFLERRQGLLLNGGHLPFDLSLKLKASPGEQIELTSPGHTEMLLGEIPRQSQLKIVSVFQTDVPEVDAVSAWAPLSFVQNLVRKRAVNRVRFYEIKDLEKLRDNVNELFEGEAILKTWEQQHQSLVWALKLESTVMVFLFCAMSLLVSLSITSGLLVFFGKVKYDLLAFWILGSSKKQIETNWFYFLFSLGLITVLLGLVTGLGFLYILDQFGPNIMPAMFVDRKIPVHVTSQALLLSFVIPFGISIIFSLFSLAQFKKNHDPMAYLRSYS